MRATGIVRKIDKAGRFSIPKELTNTYGINKYDAMELFLKEDVIFLQKHEPGCVFCGSKRDFKMYKKRKICKVCIDELAASIEA